MESNASAINIDAQALFDSLVQDFGEESQKMSETTTTTPPQTEPTENLGQDVVKRPSQAPRKYVCKRKRLNFDNNNEANSSTPNTSTSSSSSSSSSSSEPAVSNCEEILESLFFFIKKLLIFLR
jgi:hypothetical protein